MSFLLSQCQAAFRTGHFLLSVQLQSPLTGTACVSTNLSFTRQHAGTEKWASSSSDLHSHLQQWTILVRSTHSFITSPPASLHYPRWSWADSRFTVKIKEHWSRPLMWHSSSVTVPLPIPHLPKPCNAQALLLLPVRGATNEHLSLTAKFTVPELGKTIRTHRCPCQASESPPQQCPCSYLMAGFKMEIS